MIDTKLLGDFKVQAFRNATRLFRDSALLYASARYSSAFVLAVAAYEEIGKVHVIDRACDAMCLNPEQEKELYQMYIKSSRMTNHMYKQRQALFDANDVFPDKTDRLWLFVNSGGLEQARQQALYVEISQNRVRTPARITRERTFEWITRCHAALRGSGELAFSGFTADVTTKAEWLATRELSRADSALQACVVHNNRLQQNEHAEG